MAKAKRGKPPFKPTPEQRIIVSALVSCGTPIAIICRMPEIGCTPNTLRKHFPSELKTGKELANGRVAMSLFSQAMIKKPGNASTMFWLKCQAKWREAHEPEGKAPPPFEIRILSPEESKPPEAPKNAPQT